MIVFTDNEGRILDVGTTTNDSLTRVDIADDEMNPFLNKSNAEICCYQIQVDSEGHISSFSPYIDSREIHRYSHIGKDNKKVDERVDDVMQDAEATSLDIADLVSTISDVYMELCELELNLS